MSYDCDDVRRLVLRVMKSLHAEGSVRCLECGNGQSIETANIDAHLTEGWPRCCGDDMSLISVRYPHEVRATA